MLLILYTIILSITRSTLFPSFPHTKASVCPLLELCQLINDRVPVWVAIVCDWCSLDCLLYICCRFCSQLVNIWVPVWVAFVFERDSYMMSLIPGHACSYLTKIRVPVGIASFVSWIVCTALRVICSLFATIAVRSSETVECLFRSPSFSSATAVVCDLTDVSNQTCTFLSDERYSGHLVHHLRKSGLLNL